jgi:hypothetical protein
MKFSKIYTFSLVLMLLLLAACGKDTPTPATPTVTPTEAATPTATAVPASLLLVDPGGKAPQEATGVLQSFAGANGLNYWTNADLNTSLEGVKIAVVYGDAAAFQEQAAASPQTQFLFIGATNAEASGNISLIQQRPQDLYFMAGYLAELLTEDWRAGALLAGGALPAASMGDAFENGGRYICGRCSPVYPPYMSYPVYQDVSGKASAADLSADVNALMANKVTAAFVGASADLPEVLDTLEANAVLIIGENAASANAARYAAILGYSAGSTLEGMLPRLLAGQGGQSALSRVVLVAVNNPDKVSLARQGMFATTAEALANDWIIPLSVQ